jgi:TatD DNase family protein
MSEKMLIDVHAHLDFPQFNADRDAIIERAKQAGVAIINSGLGTTGIQKTLALTEKYDNIYASLGITPTEFSEKEIDATIELIRQNRDRIVAIGEVGLDYYWVKDEDKRKQEIVNFQRFIDLSQELCLPLVIHSRDAEDDLLGILKEQNSKVLMHCFGGDAALAAEAAKDGHLISIPANLANSKQKQTVVKAVPLESLVLETDAPYLAPVPKTRNEPANIRQTAEKIAEIKGVKYDVVEAATTQNAKKFFALSL